MPRQGRQRGEDARAATRPALAGTGRRTDGKVLARRDRISPIDLLAGRYPVIRRMAGEPRWLSVFRKLHSLSWEINTKRGELLK